MKYLDYFKKYKIGDYVLLNMEYIDKENKYQDNESQEFHPVHTIGKIESYNKEDDYPFHIIFHDNTDFYADDLEIKRKATKQEIEEYKLKKISSKYNIL